METNKSDKSPPGRWKIIRALRQLLETKAFNAITTAEIAKTAGVTEGLIYKYFDNKRDLLYQVLGYHFERFFHQCDMAGGGETSAMGKLRAIMFTYLRSYDRFRVFARIVLLEVRNSPDFFESRAYHLVKRHNRTILEIIEKGVSSGELRADVDPRIMRDSLFGAIEHNVLAAIIFNRQLAPETIAEDLGHLVFSGMAAPDRS